jgi:hypothetical protein
MMDTLPMHCDATPPALRRRIELLFAVDFSAPPG